MEDDAAYFGHPGRDIRIGIKALREAVPFIRKHRLWVGVLSYGWFSRFLLVVAFIAGLKFFSVLVQWAGGLKIDSPLAYGASMLDLFSRMFKEGYHLFFLGGMKYGILVLAEVLLFHVVRRTMEILKGEKLDSSFKAFIQAQVRMVQVSLMAWVLEMLVTTLVSAGLGIMDANWLKSPLSWVVQCYFLGYVVMDNYFEHYGVPVKQSAILVRRATGLALVVGLVAYVLLGLPVIGAILGPFIACIVSTLALFEMDVKNWILIPPTTHSTKKPTTH
ncbi:MAG: hypothetical protein H6563_06135 [Lewinellaceae bacterium]|nr:hypothetical protein [Lewinellaceae bacterium]